MPARIYDPSWVEVEDQEVEDQTRWLDLVFNHFHHKFDRPGWNRERQREFLLQREEWALDEKFLEGKEIESPTYSEFLDARSLPKTNAAPGTDEVPPGLLACLSDDVGFQR